MTAGAEAFVALGSNLGNREAALRRATQGLREAAGIRVLAASPVYESAAHTRPPHAPQPPFLNAVLRLETTHSPAALVKTLLALEARMGRTRTLPWAPRPLDLDLLLWADRTVHTPLVVLPHPRLHQRRFVLQPLADGAPGLWLPAPFCAPVQAILAACPDGGALAPTDIRLLD